MRLRGKTAIVTGAGSGIGRACAVAFAQEGAKVVLVGRRADRLAQVAPECGPAAHCVAADLANKADIERIVAEAAGKFGSIDILLNNAGILIPGTSEEITEEQWDQTFTTNVKATWLLSRAVLPHMRKAGRGSVINVSSSLGLVGTHNRAAYAPSKGAVVILTRCMAVDHAKDQIRFNCICPAFVETELTEKAYSMLPDPKAAILERIAKHPIGRLGKPEDIAGAAVYLASDESAWVTGSVFSIDGGYTAI